MLRSGSLCESRRLAGVLIRDKRQLSFGRHLVYQYPFVVTYFHDLGFILVFETYSGIRCGVLNRLACRLVTDLVANRFALGWLSRVAGGQTG